ncbi:MAG: prepilin-type N-terminal cleavage/methylation domain-containing protein, partial [Elusimicrobiota bacterium]|nr:prepilin-type N-terminal cleavage/methylation domain-containing protein [Elusimicrobiota bacterium]
MTTRDKQQCCKELICGSKASALGFTLAEVLVVVLVIAVLTAIAYPMYTRAITKSRAIEAINLLEMVRAKQIQNYARTRSYYNDFGKMGQLTTNKAKEQPDGATMRVGDYTLVLNNVKSCMSATYKKRSTEFTFSTSYDNAGLGCSGDICESFGNVIGKADEVCNCGDKTCSNGYTLNDDTCACGCEKACNVGGSCYDKYGEAGKTRTCSSGCGTERSYASCYGTTWSGTCSSKYGAGTESQSCGGGNGTQTRTCEATCSGASCPDWETVECVCDDGYTWNGSTCVQNSVDCPVDSKPTESEECSSGCGTQSRTVTCDTSTGTWETTGWTETCGSKSQTNETSTECSSLGKGYTGGTATRSCTESCDGGSCGEWDETSCTTSCDEEDKPQESQVCGCNNEGTQTRSVTCDTITGNWNDPESWGACSISDECECPGDANVACGNCGTRTRTCNTATGEWNDDGACTGGGECEAGTQEEIEETIIDCNGDTFTIPWSRTCGSSCSWGNWENLAVCSDDYHKADAEDMGNHCAQATAVCVKGSRYGSYPGGYTWTADCSSCGNYSVKEVMLDAKYLFDSNGGYTKTICSGGATTTTTSTDRYTAAQLKRCSDRAPYDECRANKYYYFGGDGLEVTECKNAISLPDCNTSHLSMGSPCNREHAI